MSVLLKVINSIFANADSLVFYNTLEKIFPGKGQVEDDGEYCQGRSSFGFRNAGLIEQASDIEFGE
ncbi:MAG: hypothetical protein R2860_01940 [Desulfobacterales bacterium]